VSNILEDLTVTIFRMGSNVCNAERLLNQSFVMKVELVRNELRVFAYFNVTFTRITFNK
jgi:hypothetical protein